MVQNLSNVDEVLKSIEGWDYAWNKDIGGEQLDLQDGSSSSEGGSSPSGGANGLPNSHACPSCGEIQIHSLK